MRQEGERSALRSAHLWPKGYTYSTGARESHLYTVAHLRLDRPSSAAHNRKSDPNKTRIPARAAGSPRYTQRTGPSSELGIRGMRTRLQQFEGQLKIKTGSWGTVLVASVPRHSAPARSGAWRTPARRAPT